MDASAAPPASAPRRGAAPPRFSYLIRPVNMLYADRDRQEAAVGRLKTLVDSLDSPVVVDMYRESEEITFGSRRLECSSDRTVLTARSDVSHLLDQARFGHERAETPEYAVASSRSSHIVLGSGLLARCYSLHSAPARMPAGWIYWMFQQCDFVRMFLSPIDPSAYLSVLRGSMRNSVLSEGRPQPDTIDGRAMVGEMRERVLAQNSAGIVNARVVFGAMGADAAQLGRRSSLLASRARGARVALRRVPHADAAWLRAGRTDIRVETGSLHPLFPFISSELYERGGAAWGINLTTGGAVKYDYARRRNYNIAIAATSGAGKSHTIKIITHRAKRLHPDAFVLIVDIENEYVRFGRGLGMAVVDVSPGVRLGMDPFNYMPGHRAASLFAGMLGVGTLARYSMMRAAEDGKCRSAADMVRLMAEEDSREGTDHASFARILRMGPVRAMLEGKPALGGPGGADRSAVMALAGAFAVNSEEHRMAARISLEFAMEMATRMPRPVPKIIVLDEGWALFRDEATAESVEELARRARKYNVIIIMATQNVGDILRHRHALALFNNCDTKIFLKLDERRQLAGELGLPESEVRALLSAERGEGFVHASENVVRTRMIADEGEMEMFETDPNAGRAP